MGGEGNGGKIKKKDKERPGHPVDFFKAHPLDQKQTFFKGRPYYISVDFQPTYIYFLTSDIAHILLFPCKMCYIL